MMLADLGRRNNGGRVGEELEGIVDMLERSVL